MNKGNYKKALDEIHASDDLKNKTFEKINKSPSKIVYFKYLSAIAAVFVICLISANLIEVNESSKEKISYENDNIKSKDIDTENNLPRFSNIEELKEILKENSNIYRKDFGINKEMVIEDSVAQEKSITKTVETSDTNYSTTNVQVENVDEADIVKTDGEYIYYVVYNNIYIVKADELEIISKIEYDSNEHNTFSPTEIYINKDKLIVLGNYYEYESVNTKNEDIVSDGKITSDYVSIRNNSAAKAIVYDIKNKEVPKIEREVLLDGNYINSRMINDNIYLISTKNAYYYDGLEESEILPKVKDTVKSEEYKYINCTDIIYFKNTNNYSYMIVGGFNINNKEEVNTETFFGASSDIYASENNLYITQTNYDSFYKNENPKTIIYKFNLDNSNIVLQCKGEIEGTLNNQFSMDEYEENLRIATTYTITNNNSSEDVNRLYVLDKNLEEIGRIDDLAIGEKIYSVRFIGKTGYIVTFKEVDPLFVIDLSNPTNPIVKGELKIPGYSSYLHPYDENHIIGIGYNTKDNGYGGIKNSNMKISMFDVSDLENPKEMFSIDIGKGNEYVHSDIIYNHKALFYNKEKNLIGFPVTIYEENYNYNKNGFIIFKVNLENGFEKYGEILNENDYNENVQRVIYIDDTLYTLSNTNIISYDLNTIEKKKDIVFEN